MIKEKIKHSKCLNWINGQYTDFNHGRGFFGKFTSLTNEFNFAILVTTFLFGINLREKVPEAIKFTLITLALVFLFGKFYRTSNLLEVEQRAAISRDPIQKIHLEASETILRCFGGKKQWYKKEK